MGRHIVSELVYDGARFAALRNVAVVAAVHEGGDVGLIRIGGKRRQVEVLPVAPRR